MSAGETEEGDVRIAIAIRATLQSLGWIGTEAGIFHRLGLNVTFPAMDIALEAVSGLIRGEWDFAEIGGAPIVQGVLKSQDTFMLLAAVVIRQLLSEFAATYPGAHTLPPTAVTDTSMLEELEQNGLVARLYGG